MDDEEVALPGAPEPSADSEAPSEIQASEPEAESDDLDRASVQAGTEAMETTEQRSPTNDGAELIGSEDMPDGSIEQPADPSNESGPEAAPPQPDREPGLDAPEPDPELEPGPEIVLVDPPEPGSRSDTATPTNMPLPPPPPPPPPALTSPPLTISTETAVSVNRLPPPPTHPPPPSTPRKAPEAPKPSLEDLFKVLNADKEDAANERLVVDRYTSNSAALLYNTTASFRAQKANKLTKAEMKVLEDKRKRAEREKAEQAKAEAKLASIEEKAATKRLRELEKEAERDAREERKMQDAARKQREREHKQREREAKQLEREEKRAARVGSKRRRVSRGAVSDDDDDDDNNNDDDAKTTRRPAARRRRQRANDGSAHPTGTDDADAEGVEIVGEELDDGSDEVDVAKAVRLLSKDNLKVGADPSVKASGPRSFYYEAEKLLKEKYGQEQTGGDDLRRKLVKHIKDVGYALLRTKTAANLEVAVIVYTWQIDETRSVDIRAVYCDAAVSPYLLVEVKDNESAMAVPIVFPFGSPVTELKTTREIASYMPSLHSEFPEDCVAMALLCGAAIKYSKLKQLETETAASSSSSSSSSSSAQTASTGVVSVATPLAVLSTDDELIATAAAAAPLSSVPASVESESIPVERDSPSQADASTLAPESSEPPALERDSSLPISV